MLDDEPQMRKALSRLLKTHGFLVDTFAAGEQLLCACAERRYDCIVLDLYMPGLNGFDVLGRFAQEGVPVPVIVITGQDEPGTAARVRALGAAAYLLKPLDESSLMMALSSATHLPPQAPFLSTS